jgi:hypothetical protein
MMLSEFAAAIGAEPKWVLNAQARLGLKPEYGEERLLLMGLIRVLVEEGLGLAEAHARAEGLVEREQRGAGWETGSVGGVTTVRVDRDRFFTRLGLGLALARDRAGGERRGRPRQVVRDVVAAAEAYGVDRSLVEGSLRRTPAERLRRLDEDVDFLRSLRVRRG